MDMGFGPPGARPQRRLAMTNRSIPAFARAADLIVAVLFVSLSLAIAGASAIVGA